jgi:hypothetical protein
MKKIRIDSLKKMAPYRPRGYLEDVLSQGRIAGYMVELDDEVHRALIAKYRPKLPTPIPEPTLADLASNFGSAISRWTAAGFPTVDAETYATRTTICAGCPLWDAKARFGLGKCTHKKCGCTKFKRWLTTEKCPLGKWEPAPVDNPAK